MDTRSVVRSRRRSTRLTGQSIQQDRVKRPATAKRRDSGHNTSANSSSNTSREPSCPRADPIANNALPSHDSHTAAEDTRAIKTPVKVEDNVAVPPLFPNLLSSKARTTAFLRAEPNSITTPPQQPFDNSTGNAAKDNVSKKWIKTARGSIRLASDSPAESLKNNTDKKGGELNEGQHTQSATTTRRSRRLTTMIPDVGYEAVEVDLMLSGRSSTIEAQFSTHVATGSDKHRKSESSLEGPSTKATTEQDCATHLTRYDELPVRNDKIDRLDQDPDILQDTLPIPELVADIEKIILSSPLAGRSPASDDAKGATASRSAHAFKKRAPGSILTRSRTLRSSPLSIDSTAKIEKSLIPERKDSESSQFDGAFDDSIRARRKSKTPAEHDTANKSKPSKRRGTKRSAKELSDAEGSADSPSVRQRRKPGSDGPKPDVDLSSSNPMEAATSRDAFSVDDSSVDNALEISEVARRTDEPANAVMLAQMISANPERADGPSDPIPAGDDSQEPSQLQSAGEETYKCAECGRTPERYLVCAKCQEAVYCGKYCQLWDWPLHNTRCHAADEAVQAEIQMQDEYLKGMWAAALKMLEEEDMAGGTVEALLLGEAVRHSPARPAFMGQGRRRGFVGFDVESSQSAPRNSQPVQRTRAMSILMAQAAQGGGE